MTYEITAEPPHEITGDNGSTNLARLTLEDGYGGRFHIVVDDHCYVLMCERDGKCTQVTHWFPEAVEAMRHLPLHPDDAPGLPTLRLVQ